jgi:hypothetical protein
MRFHHTYRALTGGSCNSDHHEMMLRHGWPEWRWSDLGSLVYSRLEAGYAFIPAGVSRIGEVPIRPLAPSYEAQWHTHGERYMPSYGPMTSLDRQTGFLPRGDSMLVVAAAPLSEPARAGMFLARDERDKPAAVLESLDVRPFRARVTVPQDTYLVSLEMHSARGAARARFFHHIPAQSVSGLALSDLLLFDWTDRLEPSIDAVFPRLLPALRLPEGTDVGLYWELHGGDAAASVVGVSLRVRPADAGFFQRLGETLRLVAPRQRFALEWQEEVGRSETAGRHLRIDLSELAPGRYMMELEAAIGRGSFMSARREFEIVAGARVQG